jgi:hypothetical protein
MSKKLTKKAKQVVKENIVMALVITSVLINLFFIIGAVTYASTSKFDDSLLRVAIARYCNDVKDLNLSDKEVVINDQTVSQETLFDITCNSGEFAPYYNQAVAEYLRDLGY